MEGQLINSKGICDRQNVSNFHVFVFVSVFHLGASSFFGKNLRFLFLFIVLSVLWYFAFHLVSYIWFTDKQNKYLKLDLIGENDGWERNDNNI